MQHPLVRIFRDHFNREWEVRAIQEELAEGRRMFLPKPELADGWLLFTSGEERRRLYPLPPGWYVATDDLLSRWVEEAKLIGPRDSSPS